MCYLFSFFLYSCYIILIICSYRSDTDHEIEYPLEAKEEEVAMTCLGKLVFADKYSRQSTANDSSERQVHSLSLAYEDLFTVPYNIIRDFSFTLCHLDISHNLFSR